MSAKKTEPVWEFQDCTSLLNGVSQAYDTGDYSDLTIRCGSRQWKAHRLVIYSASKFFLKAGEGEFKEAHTKNIDFKEMDPEILDKVLCYVYKRDYHADPKCAVTIHPEVYKLADYFDMQPLKQLVRKKFTEALHADWEVVGFTKALQTIYTTTPATDRGLRDVAKGHLARHKKSLRAHKGFTDLLEKNFADGRLVMDVLDAWTEYKDAAPVAAATAGVAKKPRAKKAAKSQE